MRGDKVQEYILKYLNGDKDALNEVVPHLEGMIKSNIKKYVKNFEYDELYQVGWMGVMKSLETYDPSLGILFITYCYKGINYAVRRYIQTEIRAQRLDSNKKQFYNMNDENPDTEHQVMLNIMLEQVNYIIITEFTSKVQQDILKLHIQGKCGKDIAGELNITAAYVSRTVKKFNQICKNKINK